MSADLEESVVSVTLPEMGESVTEGSIVEWRRSVGEFVAEGDPLVEVTTDKVDVEVPATASGQLTEILAREGQTVAVGTVLAQIDTSKHDGAAARPVPRGNGAQTAPPATSSAPAAPVGRRGRCPGFGSAPRAAGLFDDVRAKNQSVGSRAANG